MIRVDEDWDQFKVGCIYKRASADYCTHTGRTVHLCLEKKYCPRIPKNKPVKPALWKSEFERYSKEALHGITMVTRDKEWQAKMNEIEPDVDVLATCQKAYKGYWREEIGWKKKRETRTNTIDWYKTYEYPVRNPKFQMKKKGRYDLA